MRNSAEHALVFRRSRGSRVAQQNHGRVSGFLVAAVATSTSHWCCGAGLIRRCTSGYGHRREDGISSGEMIAISSGKMTINGKMIGIAMMDGNSSRRQAPGRSSRTGGGQTTHMCRDGSRHGGTVLDMTGRIKNGKVMIHTSLRQPVTLGQVVGGRPFKQSFLKQMDNQVENKTCQKGLKMMGANRPWARTHGGQDRLPEAESRRLGRK